MHLFLLSFVCIYVLQSIHSSPLLSIRWLALPFSPQCVHCLSAFLFVRWPVFWFTVLSFHIFDFFSSYSSICWRQFCRSSFKHTYICVPYISSSISGFIPSFDLSLVRSTSQSSMPCFIRSYIDTVVFFILRRMFLIDHFILHKLSSSGECLVQAGNIWA